VSLLKEAVLTGTPDDVIDQAAQWRDHGLRYAVVLNLSTLQPSLRRGLAASIPLATILRGLNKLRATARHDDLEAGNDRKASRGLIGSPFGASATLGTSGGQRP
jgi:hypothetical protein